MSYFAPLLDLEDTDRPPPPRDVDVDSRGEPSDLDNCDSLDDLDSDSDLDDDDCSDSDYDYGYDSDDYGYDSDDERIHQGMLLDLMVMHSSVGMTAHRWMAYILRHEPELAASRAMAVRHPDQIEVLLVAFLTHLAERGYNAAALDRIRKDAKGILTMYMLPTPDLDVLLEKCGHLDRHCAQLKAKFGLVRPREDASQ